MRNDNATHTRWAPALLFAVAHAFAAAPAEAPDEVPLTKVQASEASWVALWIPYMRKADERRVARLELIKQQSKNLDLVKRYSIDAVTTGIAIFDEANPLLQDALRDYHKLKLYYDTTLPNQIDAAYQKDLKRYEVTMDYVALQLEKTPEIQAWMNTIPKKASAKSQIIWMGAEKYPTQVEIKVYDAEGLMRGFAKYVLVPATDDKAAHYANKETMPRK